MARSLCILGVWLILTAAAHAACTPQTAADLQARGASPQLVEKMCGDATTGAKTAPGTSNVCATNLGVCPFHGPINSTCHCAGPMGAVPGVAR
jgi:hypothetical protein